MRKTTMLFLTGLLLAATLAYAGNGDLIVDGKLGVGTTSPLSTGKLFIKDDSTHYSEWNSAGIVITNNSLNDPTLRIGTDKAAGVSYIQSMHINQDWNAPLILQGVDGKVGIGTTNPDASYKLTIEGSALARNGFWQGSDAKLKKNLLPISDALSKVLQLAGVSYEWKDSFYKTKETPDGPEILKKRDIPTGRHYGVIAQEIEKVLPEIVTENAEGTKAVAYTEIIPVLIEAIKEQQKQIDELKKRLEAAGK